MDNRFIAKVRDAASDIATQISKGSDENSSAVVLFVSFDLVNSTAFKSKSSHWPLVINRFYGLAVSELQTLSDGFHVWKYVGDEVLLYKQAKDSNELARDITLIFKSVNNIVDALDNSFPAFRNFLSVKSTTWGAKVKQVSPQDMETLKKKLDSGEVSSDLTNIVVRPEGRTEATAIDFLGPDVDIGFRISKFAHNRKLVVSANLVRLLGVHSSRTSISMSNFKIVAHEELKGVWNGRPYPVVWYHERWDKIGNEFYYDELLKDGVVRTIQEKKYKEADWLEKVYSDLNKDSEIDDLKNSLGVGGFIVSDSAVETIEQNKLAEVHCAAVCFDASGRILIGLRPKAKRRLPGKWEFGCGQIGMNQGFLECIQRSYKADFGLEVTKISDHPVSTYVIESDRVIPGLIFAAQVESPEPAETAFAEGKHTEVRWVSEQQARELSSDACVPDFHGTVAKAFSYAKASDWIRSQGVA